MQTTTSTRITSSLFTGVLPPMGRSLPKAGYANQFVLQRCGRFRCPLLARQHGVHCLDVSLAYVWIFLAGDIRRTRDYAGPECLTQQGETRIWFKYLRHVVEFR